MVKTCHQFYDAILNLNKLRPLIRKPWVIFFLKTRLTLKRMPVMIVLLWLYVAVWSESSNNYGHILITCLFLFINLGKKHIVRVIFNSYEKLTSFHSIWFLKIWMEEVSSDHGLCSGAISPWKIGHSYLKCSTFFTHQHSGPPWTFSGKNLNMPPETADPRTCYNQPVVKLSRLAHLKRK